MMPIKFVSFNVRGLRDSNKRKKVFSKMKKLNSDIIMLQETHSVEDDEVLWQREWGGKILFAHGTNVSRGVAILYKPQLQTEEITKIINEEGRFINSRGKNGGESLSIS